MLLAQRVYLNITTWFHLALGFIRLMVIRQTERAVSGEMTSRCRSQQAVNDESGTEVPSLSWNINVYWKHSILTSATAAFWLQHKSIFFSVYLRKKGGHASFPAHLRSLPGEACWNMSGQNPATVCFGHRLRCHLISYGSFLSINL